MEEAAVASTALVPSWDPTWQAFKDEVIDLDSPRALSAQPASSGGGIFSAAPVAPAAAASSGAASSGGPAGIFSAAPIVPDSRGWRGGFAGLAGWGGRDRSRSRPPPPPPPPVRRATAGKSPGPAAAKSPGPAKAKPLAIEDGRHQQLQP